MLRRVLCTARLLGLALTACSAACGGDAAPPHILRVGDFQLIDQDGDAYGSAELEGHVWIVNFIFTSCTDICPMSSSVMGNLQRRLDAPEMRFVSISVDPEVDTPERLSRYASSFTDDSGRWRFLTGTEDQVRAVVRGRLRVEPGERRPRANDDGYEIPHSRSFLLVDREGTLRGTYGMESEAQARLLEDARYLLTHSR